MNPEQLSHKQRVLWLAEREDACHCDPPRSGCVGCGMNVEDHSKCERCHGTGRARLFPQLWEECPCIVLKHKGDCHKCCSIELLVWSNDIWRHSEECVKCFGTKEVVTDSLEKWLSAPEALRELLDAATKEA